MSVVFEFTYFMLGHKSPARCASPHHPPPPISCPNHDALAPPPSPPEMCHPHGHVTAGDGGGGGGGRGVLGDNPRHGRDWCARGEGRRRGVYWLVHQSRSQYLAGHLSCNNTIEHTSASSTARGGRRLATPPVGRMTPGYCKVRMMRSVE